MNLKILLKYYYIYNINILWVTTQTQLFLITHKKKRFFPWQGSGLIYILLVLWVYPNTALFNPPPKNI